MIICGSATYESKRQQNLMDKEVNAVTLGDIILAFLKWSDATITFDRKDHPDHILQLGRFPFIVDPIIGKTHLSRVPMDGGSGLNLLYTETYDAMGLSRAAMRPSNAMFLGVILELQAIPLGQVNAGRDAARSVLRHFCHENRVALG
jgi:hypothetical protein